MRFCIYIFSMFFFVTQKKLIDHVVLLLNFKYFAFDVDKITHMNRIAYQSIKCDNISFIIKENKKKR